MMRQGHNRAYMTPNEVAELLMVSPVTVRQWAQKGHLNAMTTPGGHRRFLYSDVVQFANERGIKLISDNGGLRLLVVDDDEPFARLIAGMVKSLPVEVAISIAYDGYEAGRKIVTFNPDILLLDLQMPGIDGFSVCKQVKEDAETNHIRIIAMTGFSSPQNNQRIIEAGAEACLTKPLKKSALLSILGLDDIATGRSAGSAS